MSESPHTPTFRDVDDGEVDRLVAMMDGTDAWPAVRRARSRVLERAGQVRRSLDVGAGPGTFHRMAAGRVEVAVDVDVSASMLEVARARRGAGEGGQVQADVSAAPWRSGSFDLVHAERVLQWCDDPVGALGELRRAVAAGGVLAITDTDWSTLVVDGADPTASRRWQLAAGAWIPWPTFAHDVADHLDVAGLHDIQVHHDVVTFDRWDPDDQAQHDGPPGLPLRTIAAAATDLATGLDLDALADAARGGRFHAALTLVSTAARG